MLDAYIIDAIRQEEEARRRAEDEGRRIHLDLPLPPRPRAEHPKDEAEDEGQRGPIIIPLHPDPDSSEDAA